MTNMTKDREGELFMYKVYTTTPLETYKYDMVGGGPQHFSDTIRRGVTHVTQKWKGGSFSCFRSFKIICRPMEINNDRSLKRL